jgi:hypothetical protein
MATKTATTETGNELGMSQRARSLLLVLLMVIPAAEVPAAQREENGQVAPRTLEILDVGYKLPIEMTGA